MKDQAINPNWDDSSFAREFVKNTLSARALLQKELTVNHSEQMLLQKRIGTMSEFLNDLPSSDPQYSTFLLAIQLDRIELDELQTRAHMLLQTIEPTE